MGIRWLHGRRGVKARAAGRVSGVLLLSAVALSLAGAQAPPSAAAVPSSVASSVRGEACVAMHGVSVVVDSRSLGGPMEVGCAPGTPSTGLTALADAKFTITQAQSGLVCAIDARPDPCPAKFTGSYWSYWHASKDGRWVSYQVGAGESHPAVGSVEGWRYGTGSEGPGISPSQLPQATAGRVTRRQALAPMVAAPTVSTWLVWVWGGGAAVLVALVAVLVTLRWRRRRPVDRG